MDINATLIGEMITFAIFVWFTMKYVWPPIMQAMQEREKRIADGLAAADQGERSLELAKAQTEKVLSEAKQQANHIVEKANQRANQIVLDAEEKALKAVGKVNAKAQADIELAKQAAKTDLMNQTVELACIGASKILHKTIDPALQGDLMDELIDQLSEQGSGA